jgi:hypothetical protein
MCAQLHDSALRCTLDIRIMQTGRSIRLILTIEADRRRTQFTPIDDAKETKHTSPRTKLHLQLHVQSIHLITVLHFRLAAAEVYIAEIELNGCEFSNA